MKGAEFIGSVQRQDMVLAYAPIEAKFTIRVCNSSQEADDILNLDVNGDEGDWGFSDSYKFLHPTLASGQDLAL